MRNRSSIALEFTVPVPVAEWGIQTGMHVNGAYEFFRKTERSITADVSALIKQDVLLLAGSDDHLVPVEHFYNQTKMLTNARSITTRVFMRDEGAQNHCQAGNYGLALRTIMAWLDTMLLQDAYRRGSAIALPARKPGMTAS